MNHDLTPHDALDQATRARLAKLAARPVDTARLTRRLEGMFQPEAAPRRSVFRFRQSMAWAGIAAVILVFVGVSFWPGGHSRVEASTVQMFQLHEDIVQGRLPVVPTDDLQVVRQVIASRDESPHAVGILPERLSRSCCFREMDGQPVLGMVWDVDGRRVSIAIGNKHRLMKHETGDIVQHDEQMFIVHHRDGVNMAVTTAHGRLLCFMSDAPGDQLLELAMRVVGQP